MVMKKFHLVDRCSDPEFQCTRTKPDGSYCGKMGGQGRFGNGSNMAGRADS